MDSLPIVTVICLCHNQKRYVKEAIQSVLAQTYPAVELIVMDDGSTDGSLEEIKSIAQNNPRIQLMHHTKPMGNCRAFNQAFAVSKGAFVIDLAADDVLLPDRVLQGVQDFEKTGMAVGVHFCNVLKINEEGEPMGLHFQSTDIPTGDLYRTLIQTYLVNPASMMIRREVLDFTGGYNERLLYEDFDFWIRSSRRWHYTYCPDVLVKKREVTNSLSSQQFRWRNPHQASTLAVCRTIFRLNKNASEARALHHRIRYEIKQCIRTGNVQLVMPYLRLWWKNRKSMGSIGGYHHAPSYLNSSEND
ncbi:MAG: glycosyltransferase [Cyclobacteriaceae bacterium]|nr:glycosyltransferase [Cyclobacteriaceae bacterium]